MGVALINFSLIDGCDGLSDGIAPAVISAKKLFNKIKIMNAISNRTDSVLIIIVPTDSAGHGGAPIACSDDIMYNNHRKLS